MDDKILKKEITVLSGKLSAIVVNSKESLQEATDNINQLKSVRKKVVEYWKDSKELARNAWISICDKEKEMLNPIDAKINAKDAEVKKYLIAERQRVQEEQRKADEARKLAEQKEREKLEKRAEKAEENGKIEKAEALREKVADVYIPPSIIQGEVGKTTHSDTGMVTGSDDIELTVLDPLAVVKAVAAGTIPITAIKIDQVALKKYAKAGKLKELPGCQIVLTVATSYRGRKAS